MSETPAEYTTQTERVIQGPSPNDITQARHNFVLAFQYCSNGKDFPVFRTFRVGENERIHTGYDAIDLLDKALKLKLDFQEARQLRGDIWHAILTENRNDNYQIYLKSKAWAETREKFFEQVGGLCVCGGTATEVHHKTYENIGKEELLTDLVGLCKECHREFHKKDYKGEEYWDQLKSYVKENGDNLQFFPEPSGTTIYGIAVADIPKGGAFWLVAYRDANKLEANLCMQSSHHYNVLKEKKETINAQFDDTLGELKWDKKAKRVGFFDDTVGSFWDANTDKEFPWLHDRLVRLHEVFQPIVSKL